MPFKLLSMPIKRHIREKRWDCFHPIQKAAIERIMTTNNHYILAAKTASGKTEAAFLPVISLIEEEPGIQVLYISPLVALINDQLERVEDLCRYLDITITRWHGEANRDQKEKLLENPQGILLITPESLESLFVNRPSRLNALFSNLRFIILDEIHSFVGTTRGCQLQSLISRIKALSQKMPRFIALSATLGDFEAARAFFGESRNTKVIRDRSQKEVSVCFKFFQSSARMLPAELIIHLYHETVGKKSLIFPNSRGRVEEIAVKLKKIAAKTGNSQRYFAHHSSVSKELREYAEYYAKHRPRYNFGIICTSTLELGIDIGLVDLVVQVDATFSVSSLVQRFGRSGRRQGENSRLLFYATGDWSLLQALACLELYKEGFSEPAQPLKYPVDVLFQQILSILKETSGMTREALTAKIKENHAFEPLSRRDIDHLIAFMIREEYIEVLQQEFIIGYQAEKIVNSRSFYSVFKTENNYTVFYRDKKIGELTSVVQFQIDQNIYLAAKVWKIIDMDSRKMEIYVKEAADGKRPVFSGSSGPVHPRVRGKMLEILTKNPTLPDCDEKARAAITDLRGKFLAATPKCAPTHVGPLHPHKTFVNMQRNRPVIPHGDHCEFFTFTGTRINKTLQQLFITLFKKDFFYDEIKSAFRLPVTIAGFSSLITRLKKLLPGFETILIKAIGRRESAFDFGKWGAYLPKEMKQKRLLLDTFDIPGTKEYLDTLTFKIINSE
ncbi:MAG: DEAD/DEAH box helicase [Candidatus Aminicenantes bacterium]|nr:DEAD/DEAH box helicase [Candidatus Aminicenantes bacterium]